MSLGEVWFIHKDGGGVGGGMKASEPKAILPLWLLWDFMEFLNMSSKASGAPNYSFILNEIINI